MFKWAASQELLPASVYQQLKTLEPLKRGRTDAREPDPVRPVPDGLVDPLERFVSPQVWALIQLQRLTGARCGELFKLRRIDLNLDAKTGIWTYSPEEHKTAHHGKKRTIYFGPRAQAIMQPFLTDKPVDRFLFSPNDAEIRRREEVLDLRQVAGIRTWQDMRDALHADGWDGIKTIVIDSATRAEELAVEHTLLTVPHEKGQRVQRIEDYGFGKGYSHVYDTFLTLLGDLDQHTRAGRHVVPAVYAALVESVNAESLWVAAWRWRVSSIVHRRWQSGLAWSCGSRVLAL